MGLPAFGTTLVASASVLTTARHNNPKYSAVQNQLWNYYYTLEEFSAAVNYKGNALSRVRLLAAEHIPGEPEPLPLQEGIAVDAVARLAGGIGGQSQLMKLMGIHFNVPGEGWLVGQTDEYGDDLWSVYSADELKIREGVYVLKVGEAQNAWMPLGPDSMVVRFWRPDERYSYRAASTASHALGAMGELDLINKRIVAETVSRLASNGILLYDRGKLSFPQTPNPTGAEGQDPFAQVLVEVGSRGIKDPMSAEAALKLPIGVDLGDATDVKLSDVMMTLDMSNPIDDKLIGQRESAIRRLATALDLPSDQLLGVSGMNHWGAAQVEESGIKLHIAPDAEMICHALTKGYLVPMLRAESDERREDLLRGPNGGRIIMWYDPSEIVQRPDKSAAADEAYDRMEINGVAYRREKGFSESDAPSEGDLEEMAEKLRLRAQASAVQVQETIAEADEPDRTETTETTQDSENPSDTGATEPGEAS
jgi:hypothetical protein